MLNSFAKHTRQPIDESTTNLAKKYLAVHCNLAPMPLVYAHVADDYQLMELRTHAPSIHHYSQYATPEPETFVKIMRDGYAHLRGPIDVTNRPSLSYFLDTLFPKPVGGEAWQEWENDGENWKKRALFMALNCNEKAGFYELVKGVMNAPPLPHARFAGVGNGIGEVAPQEPHPLRPEGAERMGGSCNTGGDTGKDQIDDMCTKLQKLKLSNNMPPVSPQELASIINDLDMTNCDMSKQKQQQQKQSEKKHVEEDEAMEREILPLVKQRLRFTAAPVAPVAALAATGDVPSAPTPAAYAAGVGAGAVGEYRKRACLPATISPLRIAKQLFFSAMQLQGNEHPAFEKLKTADQTHFSPVVEGDLAAVDHCIDTLVDKEKLTQLLQAHAEEPSFFGPAGAEKRGGSGAEINSAQFLKDMIKVYSKAPPPAAAGSAKYNKPSDALINVILGL